MVNSSGAFPLNGTQDLRQIIAERGLKVAAGQGSLYLDCTLPVQSILSGQYYPCINQEAPCGARVELPFELNGESVKVCSVAQQLAALDVSTKYL